jgi:hypothetical protein
MLHQTETNVKQTAQQYLAVHVDGVIFLPLFCALLGQLQVKLIRGVGERRLHLKGGTLGGHADVEREEAGPGP